MMMNRVEKTKRRLVVMTDISSLQAGELEPDDTQSLVRLLLYSNHFDIEGLIATQYPLYQPHSEHCEGKARPEYLEAVIRQYGKVRENLLRHSPDYPGEEELLGCIRAGSPFYGMEHMGEGMDSPGSEQIIEVVDRPDPRPVWIIIWGGEIDLAQALWRVKTGRSETQFQAFCSRIRVYAIADQYDGAGPWIRENCPEVMYLTSNLGFRGMYKDGDQTFTSGEWVERNIRQGHGPLGEAYPNYDGGDMWGPVKGLKEGDTPSLLYMLPVGPGCPDHPEWGSWGGRFAAQANHYFDAMDELNGVCDERVPVYRWRREYQNSFQARMDWCVRSYEEANHEPVARVEGPMHLSMKPGDTVKLNAGASFDPDGDDLSFRWWVYREAGTYPEEVFLENADTSGVTVRIPDGAAGGDIHVMLSLTDTGEPPLTGYHRIIITVEP